jgi:hypothetical protein
LRPGYHISSEEKTMTSAYRVLIAWLVVSALSCVKRAEPAGQSSDRFSTFYAGVSTNATAYCILGDLNGDRHVNKIDFELLQRFVHDGKITGIRCPAAGDWSGNHAINTKDLSIAASLFERSDAVKIPLLTTVGRLGCDASYIVLYAPGYVHPGEDVRLQFAPSVKSLSVTVRTENLKTTYDAEHNEVGFTAPDVAGNSTLHFRLALKFFDTPEGEEDDYDLDIPEIPYPPAINVDNPHSKYADSLGTVECPQRGEGCEVLILDFIRNNQMIGAEAHDLIQPFKDCGCNVIYSAPTLLAIPQPSTYTMDDGTTVTVPPDSAEVAAVKANNDSEWTKMENAIQAHRAAVSAGREVAIEIIRGHGNTKYVGGPDNDGKDLERIAFHTGNYTAANHHVCAWFSYDITCQAGYTPLIVDNLENTGKGSLAKNTLDANVHAAWELDYAFGSSGPREATLNGRAWLLDWELKSMAKRIATDRKDLADDGHPETDHILLIDVLSEDDYMKHNALYTDKGYQLCNPHVHVRQGY